MESSDTDVYVSRVIQYRCTIGTSLKTETTYTYALEQSSADVSWRHPVKYD